MEEYPAFVKHFMAQTGRSHSAAYNVLTNGRTNGLFDSGAAVCVRSEPGARGRWHAVPARFRVWMEEHNRVAE